MSMIQSQCQMTKWQKGPCWMLKFRKAQCQMSTFILSSWEDSSPPLPPKKERFYTTISISHIDCQRRSVNVHQYLYWQFVGLIFSPDVSGWWYFKVKFTLKNLLLIKSYPPPSITKYDLVNESDDICHPIKSFPAEC